MFTARLLLLVRARVTDYVDAEGVGNQQAVFFPNVSDRGATAHNQRGKQMRR